jgi:hypothetical protein
MPFSAEDEPALPVVRSSAQTRTNGAKRVSAKHHLYMPSMRVSNSLAMALRLTFWVAVSSPSS